MTVNVSIFYQNLSAIRSKIYYSNIWYVLPDFSITFYTVYFAFEKKFQIQHKSGKFFHKAWQLICVNISSKSKLCTKLGGFLTNEILLIHQTSDINTKRVYYRNARHHPILFRTSWIFAKKNPNTTKDDIFSIEYNS